MAIYPLFLVVFISTFALSACSGGLESFREEPTSIVLNEGENIVLACKIFHRNENCSWTKDDGPIQFLMDRIEWAGDPAVGDCSINVFNITIQQDGIWKCQVTSANAQNALKSEESLLIVRVPPEPPDLEANEQSGSIKRTNFTLKEGVTGTIKCNSRNGNPPGSIKWFLGSSELDSSVSLQKKQLNSISPKTWLVSSILQKSFDRNDDKKVLKCVVYHPSYANKSESITTFMNILYSPEITTTLIPVDDIEEYQSKVILECISEANPPPTIIWKRVEDDHIFGTQNTLEFNTVLRKHSGTYFCEASNSVGTAISSSIVLDVKYRPVNIQIQPVELRNIPLHSNLTMHCFAEANPISQYKWFKVTSTREKYLVGSGTELFLKGINYFHAGLYECVAYNYINEYQKEVTSDPLELTVVGAPLIISNFERDKNLEIELGLDIVLHFNFCSNPKPESVAWHWGSFEITSGHGKGRYIAERLLQNSHSYCYQAKLRIQSAILSDARNYCLTVTNNLGEDHQQLILIVNKPITMMSIIGMSMAFFILLAVITIGIFYAFKSEKCCFSRIILASFPAYTPTKSSFWDQEKENPFVNLWLQKCSFSNLEQRQSSIETTSLDSQITF